MTKEEVYKFLEDKNIKYEKQDHGAVFSMEDLEGVKLLHDDANAKNLFCYDKKNKKYYLIIVSGDDRVNLKKLKKDHGIKSLNFASDEQLKEVLDLTPGSVSPMGILNDKNNQVDLYIDNYFAKEGALIACHPNDNTVSIWLKVSDLIKLVEENGNTVHFYSNSNIE